MKKSFYIKLSFLLITLLLGVWMILPSILRYNDLPPNQQPWYAKILPKKQLKLGLDLRGGIHLVLGVDVQKAVENEAERYAVDLHEFLDSDKIPYTSISRDPAVPGVIIQLKDAVDKERLLSLMTKKINVLKLDHQDDANQKLFFTIDERKQNEIERDTISQALETIRNRIDQFGVSEPEITAQGRTRIIVQLPGLADPERARQILGKTAQLEFKLVNESLASGDLFKMVENAKKEIKTALGVDHEPSAREINDKLKAQLPQGTELLFGEDKDATAGQVLTTPYVIESKVLLTGEMLEDAHVSPGGQFNEPVVNLRFNPRGAEIFEKVTRENVKRRLAIVLDDKVNSAPAIQGAIPGGRAQITMGALRDRKSLMNEAHDLAIVLKAGALPAPVDVLENRSVGPSLGSDSIRMGTKASLIGTLLVFVFMLAYYRTAGMFANIALIYNMLFLLVVLVSFEATLTLPGIAGLVLTLGMAVDANIIIYERIREELGLGKDLRTAISDGYDRAHLTVLDSNLTTMIAGIVLLEYGSGPVKGFAVTLIIGLITSYVTSIWFSKYCFDLLMDLGWKQHNLFTPKKGSL